MSDTKPPILTPPIHRARVIYWLTRIPARQGVDRFHRITTIEGLENLPSGLNPIIFIVNHQNGMMDPMVISGLMKPQIHWLTRADVFWKRIPRAIMYAFNQMPIYRKRDNLTDSKKRNEIIWDCCIERFQKGAVLGLFPEGNHQGRKTIRPIKRGLSDLLGLSMKKYPDLKRIKLIPIGLDYEFYPKYRKRLALRMGHHIQWHDLFDESSGLVDYKVLAARVNSSLRELAVDIQPSEHYDDLKPYVRSMRTAEAVGEEEWGNVQSELRRIQKCATDANWLKQVLAASGALKDAGFNIHMSPESWGRNKTEIRPNKLWVLLTTPISWLANLPTSLIQFILNRKGEKIKLLEFRSTFKVGTSIFLYPIFWTITAIGVGFFAKYFEIMPFGAGYLTWWVWATLGNRFYGWHLGYIFDRRQAIEGEEFWAEENRKSLREAWKNYIAAIQEDPRIIHES